MIRAPCNDNPSGWGARLFIPELYDYNPDWEMAYCDPYPDGPPVGNMVELRYLCDEDFRPVNPFIVRLVPKQPPILFVRAQLRHPKACQQDLLLCKSRLKHVRDGLRTYPEMTTYVTKGMVEEVCWEMLASALQEWDATGLLGSNKFGKFLEEWFEREKRRLGLCFGREAVRQASTRPVVD